MGTDIHLVSELKIKGEWHCYTNPFILRNYRMFGYLAGVRNNFVKPVAYPKGIPDDISIVTRKLYEDWEGTRHTESWLGMEETEIFKELVIKDPEICINNLNIEEKFFGNFLFGNTWDTESLEELKHLGIEDARIVFWFDS